MIALALLCAACAGAELAPEPVVEQLAPTGRLRAAMARDDPLAAELARLLARRLGVSLYTTTYDAPFDVAFALPEAARAAQLDFTAPYAILDGRPRVMALARGRPAAGEYLRDFLDELRDSGELAALIERRRLRERARLP
ncbi:MAG TPA: hypothetical protein VF211_06150 [Burkholderiales bacterium]